jgi:hypothetical protein
LESNIFNENLLDDGKSGNTVLWSRVGQNQWISNPEGNIGDLWSQEPATKISV